VSKRGEGKQGAHSSSRPNSCSLGDLGVITRGEGKQGEGKQAQGRGKPRPYYTRRGRWPGPSVVGAIPCRRLVGGQGIALDVRSAD